MTYYLESKKTLYLAIPFVANQVLQMSVVTIDSLMAGAKGKLTLAAVAQGSMLWHFVVLGIIGILMPLNAMIAKSYARKDSVQLKQLFQQAFWLSIPLGFIGFLLMWLIAPVMSLFSVDEKIIAPATEYIRIIAFTMPLLALFMPVRYFNEGIANPAVMTVLTATSIPFNIIGNYVLLNGLWGFPEMGAKGVAYATLMAEIYLVVGAWWYVLKHPKMKTFSLMENLDMPRAKIIFRQLRIGIPCSLTLLMESGMFTTMMLLSGRLGVEAAAANQIAFNYIANVFTVPLGISMALTTRIGMAAGKNNLRQIRIIGISGFFLSAVFMLFSVIVIYLFGQEIARLYSNDKTVISIATQLLTLAGVFQIFDGLQVAGGGSLRGLEETKSPMQYAAVGYWLLAIPIAVIFAFSFKMGVPGLWWGLVAGLFTTAVLMVRKFLQMTAL